MATAFAQRTHTHRHAKRTRVKGLFMLFALNLTKFCGCTHTQTHIKAFIIDFYNSFLCECVCVRTCYTCVRVRAWYTCMLCAHSCVCACRAYEMRFTAAIFLHFQQTKKERRKIPFGSAKCFMTYLQLCMLSVSTNNSQ